MTKKNPLLKSAAFELGVSRQKIFPSGNILNLFLLLFTLVLRFIKSKHSDFPNFALLYIQNQYFLRYFKQHNIRHPFEDHEKQAIHFFFKDNETAEKFFSLVSPHTVLKAWQNALAKHWTQKKKSSSPGRPRITKKIKDLIREIKIKNYLWGCRRIRDELSKLNIDVSHETIQKVIQHYRKTGDIKSNDSWSNFLSSHWKSLSGTDFFTVDIFGFKRFYVFFIIKLSNRKIVHWNITTNPNIRFLRLQFSEFVYENPDSYLIHDNSGELKHFPYDDYGIKDVPTSPYSPNMNAYAERFIRSMRQECLDHFIIFSERQLRNIVREYMNYYNCRIKTKVSILLRSFPFRKTPNYRPHQGLKAIPNAPPSVGQNSSGKIKKKSVLFGLHHHYYRETA